MHTKELLDLTNRCFLSVMEITIGIGELLQEFQQLPKDVVKVTVVFVLEFLECREQFIQRSQIGLVPKFVDFPVDK